MHIIELQDSETTANLGRFKTTLKFNIGDEIVFSEDVYVIERTLKFLYPESDDVEYIYVKLLRKFE